METHCSRHLGSICPGNVVVQPLPSRNPAAGRVTDGDQAFEDLRGAFLNGIVIPTELENIFAVRTAVTHEFLNQTAGQRFAINVGVAIAVSTGNRELSHYAAEQRNKPCRRAECAAGSKGRRRTSRRVMKDKEAAAVEGSGRLPSPLRREKRTSPGTSLTSALVSSFPHSLRNISSLSRPQSDCRDSLSLLPPSGIYIQLSSLHALQALRSLLSRAPLSHGIRQGGCQRPQARGQQGLCAA